MEPGTTVVGQGEVLLHVKAASSRSAWGLASVLHVPEATANLFSAREVEPPVEDTAAILVTEQSATQQLEQFCYSRGSCAAHSWHL